MFPLFSFLLFSCSEKEQDTAVEAICSSPQEIVCFDDLLLDLSLQGNAVSEGGVETQIDGEDFVTRVDASAGGYNNAANNPWVYIRFTDSGAEKIEIDDEKALFKIEVMLLTFQYMH